MITLTIRTDKPESELGLYDGQTELAYKTWQAHRQLAETLHQQIANLLQSLGKGWDGVDGIVVYEGPGSFTGLRIGVSVANALAYGLGIPLVATSGEDWVAQGLERLGAGDNDKTAIPEYGAPVHITQQKK